MVLPKTTDINTITGLPYTQAEIDNISGQLNFNATNTLPGIASGTGSYYGTLGGVNTTFDSGTLMNADSGSVYAADTGDGTLYQSEGLNSEAGGLGFNTQTLGAVAGLGSLGLGYLNYKDSHAMNKQNLESAKFNLAEAKTDSAATAAYRASYGA